MTDEDKFKNLCSLTTKILGLRKGSLSSKSRRSELQIPRSVSCIVARMVDDIHPTVIAKGLKRHRVSIYHYEKMHESYYSTWEKYRDTFNLIYNAYTSIKGAKRSFSDMFQLYQHLKEGGVKHSPRPQTTIRINSGDVGVDIKVSYRDFYNQLELCKFALRDYNYMINII